MNPIIESVRKVIAVYRYTRDLRKCQRDPGSFKWRCDHFNGEKPVQAPFLDDYKKYYAEFSGPSDSLENYQWIMKCPRCGTWTSIDKICPHCSLDMFVPDELDYE